MRSSIGSPPRDISGSISIDDDGPKANNDYDSVTEGPGNAATGNVVTGVNPENALLGTDGNGTDGTADNPGQDKPYTISKLTHDGHDYTLSADGSASLASDTLTLRGTDMPESTAIYLQGTTQENGGAGVLLGDGLRCVGGSLLRLKTVVQTGGGSELPAAGDPSLSMLGQVTQPGTRTYQVWYRNPAAFCTSDTYNLSNGVRVTWTP